jgi:hypothetical protein
MHAHPAVGFKFKIDSCYSGRFITDLPKSEYPNLVLLETASSATQVSWSYLGKTVWVKNGQDVDANTPGATAFPNNTDNPGNTNAPDPGDNATYGRGEWSSPRSVCGLMVHRGPVLAVVLLACVRPDAVRAGCA